MFSREINEIFKYTCFEEYLWKTASDFSDFSEVTNKSQNWRNLIEKRPWLRYFSMNFAKILRTPNV